MKTNALLLIAACMCAWMAGCGVCAEDSKPVKGTAPKDAKDPADKAAADPYAVPETKDSAVLMEFCKSLLGMRGSIHSQAEYGVYMQKMRPALKSACEKIVEVEKGDTTPNGRFARRFLLSLDLGTLMGPDAAKKTALMDSIKKFLSAQEMTSDDIGMAMQTAQLLERSSEEEAKDFYGFTKKVLDKSKAPAAAMASKRIDGTLRRLNLLGNSIELKGTTVDGKPFDVNSLKGKVVLVDFWATWCHYCIEEMPNVQKNYAGYHKKGFEVVAISADQTREPLDAFLAEKKLPWIQLWDKDGINAAMEYYAIAGYPTTFMIGKSGKVISLAARAEELTSLLKKELGDPDPVADEAAKPALIK